MKTGFVKEFIVQNYAKILSKSLFVLSAIVVCSVSGILTSCTVSKTYVKEGYSDNEKLWLKKLALVFDISSSSLPSNAVQNAFLDLSRDYVSHHNEYMITHIISNANPQKPEMICSMAADADGYLLNTFESMKQTKGVVDLGLRVRLIDCRHYSKVWEVHGSNSFDSYNSDLQVMIDSYVRRHSEEVRPYISPFYLLIRKIYRSLPDPLLTENDVDEKIEIDSISPAFINTGIN